MQETINLELDFRSGVMECWSNAKKKKRDVKVAFISLLITPLSFSKTPLLHHSYYLRVKLSASHHQHKPQPLDGSQFT